MCIQVEVVLVGDTTQFSSDDTANFLCVKSVHAMGLNSDLSQYKDKIIELLLEFKQRFQIFGKLKMDLKSFAHHSQ